LSLLLPLISNTILNKQFLSNKLLSKHFHFRDYFRVLGNGNASPLKTKNPPDKLVEFLKEQRINLCKAIGRNIPHNHKFRRPDDEITLTTILLLFKIGLSNFLWREYEDA